MKKAKKVPYLEKKKYYYIKLKVKPNLVFHLDTKFYRVCRKRSTRPST